MKITCNNTWSLKLMIILALILTVLCLAPESSSRFIGVAIIVFLFLIFTMISLSIPLYYTIKANDNSITIDCGGMRKFEIEYGYEIIRSRKNSILIISKDRKISIKIKYKKNIFDFLNEINKIDNK